MPECWATCELRFDHRQQKQHPRSSCTATLDTPSRRSHRELPENISHAMPRQGRSAGTDAGVLRAVQSGAESDCREIRSLHSLRMAKQTIPSCSRRRQLPGHMWIFTVRWLVDCGLRMQRPRTGPLPEALRHHCRRHCAIIVGSIARSLSEVLREHCRTRCGCIAYGGDPRCLGSLCRGK